MTASKRISPTAIVLMLAASVAAAAPVARWCPLRWDEVDPAMFLECAMQVSGPEQGCAERAAAAVPTCGANERSGDCAVAGGCPMRDEADPAPETSDATAPRHAPGPTDARGRAYCLEDPPVSLASLGMGPDLPAPFVTAAVVAAVASLAAPVRLLVRPRPESDERPTSAPPEARPPVRGPPVFLG